MKKLFFVALAAIFTLSGSMVMAQPPQGQGGRGGQRQEVSLEERMAQLNEAVELTPEQFKAIEKFQADRKQPERGDREAMQKMMAEEKEFMGKVLDKKQYKKWEKYQESQRPQRPEGGQRPQ